MTPFDSPAHELAITEQATEKLLHEIATGAVSMNEHTLFRLEKLAAACARLAFKNDLILGAASHSLVTWCDHLDDQQWKANFFNALKVYPLKKPW
jgi:hypothetical protein